MLAMQAAADPPPGVEVRAPKPSTKDRSDDLTRGPSSTVPIRYLGVGQQGRRGQEGSATAGEERSATV